MLVSIKELMKLPIADLRLSFEYDAKNGILYRKRPIFVGKNYTYISVTIAPKTHAIILAHRLAWAIHHDKWPENEIDHINGDKRDIRIANLRDVTPKENMASHFRLRRNQLKGR